MAKGPATLAVAAALGALVWMWPSTELPAPSIPHRSEQDAGTGSLAPAIVREEAKLSEQAPPPDQAKPADETAAHKPTAVVEPPPDWINEARFIEAGLTPEQAAELGEGMRKLHQDKYVIGENFKRSSDPSAVCPTLIMLDLGPRLADLIKDGSVSLQWIPRLRPWPQFSCNSFGVDVTPGSVEPLQYSAQGRAGIVSLKVPRKLCNQELWALMVPTGQAK